MSDDSQSRRPFGERDEEEKQLPFGSRSRPASVPPRREPSEEPPVGSHPRPPLSPLDPLLGGEDDPAGLSWETLLSDVDTPAAPPRVRPREDQRLGTAAEPQSEPETKSPPRSGRFGQGLHLPDRSFLKRRSRPQEIAAASYVEDLLDEEEPAERPQVVIRFSVVLRSMGIIVLTAVIMATLFTWWTPGAFLPSGAADQLAIAQATQARQQAITRTAPESTIGIVSGHRGLHPSTGLPDPGAVCADGLTEQQVNENVAKKVQIMLQREGYQVDLLDEFDARLQSYKALTVVSIHSDSCEFINDQATGFKVASFAYSSAPEADAQLVSCLNDRYAAATGLPLHPSITNDM
ncbi:MAG: N-acetylmuramoyl-L-alanine amidase, partial [Chloroflexi bacterium]